MHVHAISFKGHVKRLLRISYREGKHVRKYTIANLSDWTSTELAEIERILAFRRYCFDDSLRNLCDMQIYNSVMAHKSSSKRWRLTRAKQWRLTGRPLALEGRNLSKKRAC